MPSTALQVALALSVALNLLQLMTKYKEATRWKAVRMFKLALDKALQAAGPGSTFGFTMTVNGASMQLRRSLPAASAQLATATWLQQHADPARFRIDFQGYKFKSGSKSFVMIDCAIFYDDSDEPFVPINVRHHHMSLFQVEGHGMGTRMLGTPYSITWMSAPKDEKRTTNPKIRLPALAPTDAGHLTSAEKMLLPLLHGNEARGFKLYSGQSNPCKTSLLVEVPTAFLVQLDAFLENVSHCQWAATTEYGTKMHVAL